MALKDNEDLHKSVCVFTLVVYSSYFIVIQLWISTRNVKKYFSLNNMVDLIPNGLILYNALTRWTYDEDTKEFWLINAFGGLLLWIKFLMMLRVFEYTGHLIHMLL